MRSRPITSAARSTRETIGLADPAGTFIFHDERRKFNPPNPSFVRLSPPPPKRLPRKWSDDINYVLISLYAFFHFFASPKKRNKKRGLFERCFASDRFVLTLHAPFPPGTQFRASLRLTLHKKSFIKPQF